MSATHDPSAFIRDEFECFIRIGLDVTLRRRVQKVLEHHLITEGQVILGPTIYLETRDPSGELREMWYMETDSNQLMRLLEFLRRFSLDDVRLIDSMLHRL
jgi:hypothetical protein